MTGVWQGLFGALLVLAACSGPDPLAGTQPGEHGRVVRVIDGDALVLDTGQSVRLIGIEAPAGPYKDREGAPFYTESKRMLEDMALGREVQLFYAGLTRDRYDRALAHVMTTDALGPDLWLNREMVARGGARVRVYPDTAGANGLLLAPEAKAREAKLGLWKTKAYRIPVASDLPEPFEKFQLVEGVTGERLSTDEQGASCELALAESALTLEIQTSAAALCQTPMGTAVRARGYVYRGKLEISHPLNLETLPRD
ncbi:MAG: thermonuclease family protein [Hyphomonas oceanitis]|uniref:thermonuclease family protein n=1 Tax=Hyphomonas oceanitis TaxID=81033 RepID=UPI003001CE72